MYAGLFTKGSNFSLNYWCPLHCIQTSKRSQPLKASQLGRVQIPNPGNGRTDDGALHNKRSRSISLFSIWCGRSLGFVPEFILWVCPSEWIQIGQAQSKIPPIFPVSSCFVQGVKPTTDPDRWVWAMNRKQRKPKSDSGLKMWYEILTHANMTGHAVVGI